ncbi:MAG: hypothetical protein LBJ20_05380 [Candidatus Methanoplasma sp.]|nr:hypothetical protein [Candidatus Methanoplasma sp.]
MVNNKLMAIAAAVILAAAAVGVYAFLNSGETEKKALYKLGAVVSEVDMGKCSATPAVIVTIEDMYRDYYGDLVSSSLTLADAKADTEFWNEYCSWEPMLKANPDGTYDVKITTGTKGTDTKKIPVSDTALAMGTMYSETLYYLICTEYGEEMYSDESYANQNILDYMNGTIAGGMQYSYYEDNDVDYMLKTVSKDSYYDLGVNSVQSLDSEKLTSALRQANEKTDGNVIYFASGTRILTSEHYNNNTGPCDATESYYAFFSPSEIKEVFPSIQCIGLLMGFSEETVDKLIEDIQLRLYRVYHSVQEKTDGGETVKAYWEGSSGKAINSAMGKVILNFLGFDTSLLDGAEHDLESLLTDKPVYLVWYTNDGRNLDERMRINN